MDSNHSPEKQQFVEGLLRDPSVLQWFEKFKPGNWEGFLADYYAKRSDWLKYGERHRLEHHEWLTMEMNQANLVLTYIQHKKLWDLQCLWRSEQAEVLGIRHSAEFLAFEPDIMRLEFLSPITTTEIETLKGWLMDYKYARNLYRCHGFQDYQNFVEMPDLELGIEVPSYYEFVDRSTNTVPLWRVLPDVRGQKERHYRSAAIHARIKASEAAMDPEILEKEKIEELLDDRKPFYYGHFEFIEFATLFDDHRVNECRIASAKASARDDDHELNFAIETLRHAAEPVALEPHPDWREGILYTAWKHERAKLLPCIDVAYENYLFRRQMGIAAASEDEDGNKSYLAKTIEGMGNEILDGREALGEPRDFNF